MQRDKLLMTPGPTMIPYSQGDNGKTDNSSSYKSVRTIVCKNE